MLIDRDQWKAQRFWIAIFALGTLSATLWYAIASILAKRFLGGSSLPGFTFGVIGGLICLFEFLLWPRKRYRRLRLGRTQEWMKAHIWLGLLSLPVLVFHSGFRLGGSLSGILMVLFLVVIASGVWGLILQNWLPKKMLAEIPAETIHSQIPRIIDQYHDEAARLVVATCGRLVQPAMMNVDPGDASDESEESTHHLVVGAVRSAGRIRGKVLQTKNVSQTIDGSEPLRSFFDAIAGPFLNPNGFKKSPLRRRERASLLFEDLKTKLDPKAHEAADTLRNLCDQRRELAEQDTMHWLLHNWLLIHLPLSVALIVLMFVHVFEALKYL
jgi:hypothetical protein